MSVTLLEILKKYQDFQKRPEIISFPVFVWLFSRQKHAILCIFHILVLEVINLNYQNSIEENF